MSLSHPRPAAEEWKGKLESALESGMVFDSASTGGWCQHVQYDDLIANPIGTVRRIYAYFGDETTRLPEHRMSAWMEQDRPSAGGRHAYDPADFGWSYPALAEEFAYYTQRYDVRTG